MKSTQKFSKTHHKLSKTIQSHTFPLGVCICSGKLKFKVQGEPSTGGLSKSRPGPSNRKKNNFKRQKQISAYLQCQSRLLETCFWPVFGLFRGFFRTFLKFRHSRLVYRLNFCQINQLRRPSSLSENLRRKLRTKQKQKHCIFRLSDFQTIG